VRVFTAQHRVSEYITGVFNTRPDPPVQCGRVWAGQFQLLQPAGAGQRHPGQRFRVDIVRLRVPAQEPPQIRGLR